MRTESRFLQWRGMAPEARMHAMDRIRILFTTSEPYYGSIARVVKTTIDRLDQDHFETSVACPPGAAIKRFAAAGATTFRVEMPTKYDLRPILRLSRIIREYRPHIVHAQSMRAAFFSAIAARNSEAVVVQTEHNWTDSLAETPTDEGPRAVTRLLHKLLMRRLIAQVIVLSTSCANFFVKTQKLDPAKVRTIYAAVDPPPQVDASTVAAKAAALGVEPGDLVVSSFGRQDIVKGLTYLVSAVPHVLASNPNTFFCLFGDGKERERLQAQAVQLGIGQRVLFPGWVHDTAEMIALSDVVVTPSLSEAAPRVVMEAMASGKPQIVTNAGGSPEYVGSDAVGLIVPPMDPNALANAIGELLANESLRRRMGTAARERYEEQFRPERFAADLESTYSEALAEHKAPNDTGRSRT